MMAELSNASLSSLAKQVNELSEMLNEVESGVRDIHRVWDGMAKREFRRYGLSSYGGSRTNTEGKSNEEAKNAANTNSTNTGGMDTDLLSNLGAVFGKSPREMMELLGQAQSILAGTGKSQGSNGDLWAKMEGILRGGNVQDESNRSAQASTGDESSSTTKVAANLPAKLQSIAHSIYEAADQDPFVRTAVELDSRLKDMSDTIESMIGIILLVRDISARTRSTQ